MPENVLYNPKNVNSPGQGNTSQTNPVSQVPVVSTTPAIKPRQQGSWLPQTPSVPAGLPKTPPSKPSSSLGLLIRIGIGVFMFAFLLGVTLFFILPILRNTGAGGKVTLTYWSVWEDQKIMQPIFNAFEKKYPNISIKFEQQNIKQFMLDNQPYPKRLIARINAGSGPDIFRFHNTWYPVLSNVLAPMTKDVVSTQEFSSTYFPVVTTDLVHNGAIYGVPLDFDTLSLFVNPTIFQQTGTKIPTDWLDVQTDASELTVKGTDGTITTSEIALGTLTNVNHGSDILGLLFADSGVDPTNITANQQNAVNALQFFLQFANGKNATWSEAFPQALQQFANGNLAMYIGYSWDIPVIQKLNPSLRFAIYPVPADLGVKRTIASYWVDGVSIRSQHMQEAMEFMNFLNQKETQQQFYASAAKVRGFGELYARPDLGETLKSNALLYPFEAQGPTAVSTIFNADTYDGTINTMSNQYLQNAIEQINSNSSPTDAVTTFSNGMKQVTQMYGL